MRAYQGQGGNAPLFGNQVYIATGDNLGPIDGKIFGAADAKFLAGLGQHTRFGQPGHT
jgi:hypothetical protein